MRALLAAVLACAALVGCDLSPPRMHYSVFVAPDLGGEQVQAIVRGLSQWEARSGGAIAFDVYDGVADDGREDAVVLVASDGDGEHVAFTSAEPGNRAVVWFARDALAGDLQALERTAAHEGGHVLSLDHAHDDEDSVMRVRVSGRRVTCRDVRAACAHRGAECGCAE